MDKYIENCGKYTKRVRMLYVCSLLLFVFLAVFEYVCSGKILAAIGALACGVVMFFVIKLLQKADDDSLVSRLQSKVDKIIDALKLQNSRERLEHENIKGLVSDLSHQLKTPISNLRMYTDFLKNPDISDDERTRYLQVLELAVERLSFLSESMIKVSRLESGLINLDVKSQSINDTVLQAVKDVYVSAKKCRYNYQI